MHISFKKFFLTAAAIFITAQIFSASGENQSYLNSYISKSWTAADGLPGNTITDLLQAKNGYIYMGSYEGLVRFDGVQFNIIKRNSDERVSFASARTIFEDSKENLWIGANDEGVTCIYKNGNVSTYSTKNGLPNNSIRAICEDKEGTIWVGTSAGLACIKSGQIVIPDTIEFLPRGNHYLIKSLMCDRDGIVWVVTEDTGEVFFYKDNAFYTQGRFQSVKESSVTSIMQDSDGNFWFGIAPYHLIKITGRAETVFDVSFGKPTGSAVNSIYEDSKKNIWCCLDNGIVLIRNGKMEFLDNDSGLVDEKIKKIIEDREENIWIATDRGGVQKFSKSKFNTISISSTINAIAEDNFRNCVWFASDNGLFCWKNDKLEENKITELCKGIRTRHVEVTNDGKVLVSTYNKLGQVEIDLNGNVRSWKKESGLAGNKVRVAIKAKDGNLYVGTTTGLSIIADNNQITEIKKDIGIQNDYIMCIYEADDGKIWCGTDGGGIFILKNGELDKVLNTENGLAGNVVFKIFKMAEDEIWITTGTGISVYKNGTFKNFDTSAGLGSDSIFQAIDDGIGKIWFTSNRGIFAVKTENFRDAIDGKVSKVTSKFYGISDGIRSGGVTSTSLSMKDKNGNIWFTLIDGVTKYDSQLAMSNKVLPLVQVEEIWVGSRKYRYEGFPIVVSPSENRISIKFTGLSYASPEQLQFKTKLEGFDADFSEWSNERIVSYTNLRPKTYNFSVKAISSDDVESDISPAVTIIKQPAIWQHFWFWVLAVILFIFIVYKIIKTRISYIRREKEKIETMSEEVIRALAGTIDAKDTYTNGHSARVAEYAKKIAAKLGKNQEEQDDIYRIANLHDIGKIGIPDTIINKPGKLTDEEFDMIKKHPVIGSEILKSIKSMPEIEVGARWHHERYDGKGYPDGLAGNAIPEIARIICVADSYDAMTSNRSYRKYLPQETVREEFVKCSGTQFDPKFAKIMVDLIDEDKNYTMHE
ncbi:MAG: HD domain-containing protein [Treponema sp.]|nr:HD domain-containing protein [Candidatus Treponema equifaecale]